MEHNTLKDSEGRAVIVLFPPDEDPKIVTESHPNFLRITEALEADADPTPWLDASIAAVVEHLSSRVSVVGGVLHFDGDPVYNGLASTIERYRVKGQDATNLVRFMERLSANPNAHSREQLFTWTEARNLTVDSEGFIIAYKGVGSRSSDRDYLDAEGNPLFPLDRYPFQSSSSGHGIVDGHEIHGYLPMGVDVTVEMPRDEVAHNPSRGCSTGLHVGTHDYAKGYSTSGALLEVRFDPADVVSVPSDCGWAKLRCCRYTGVAIHEPEVGDDLSDYEPEATWDEDEAMDAFMTSIPDASWRERFVARIRRKKA